MTKKYVLIGDRVSGSLSPQIHNPAFHHYNIDALYSLCHTSKKELKEKINLIKDGLIHGANITIPYKTEVIQFVDEVSHIAAINQSVNTLYMLEGKLIGDSTDGFGALKSLEEENIQLENIQIAVLGTGGSAKAVLAAILNKYNVRHVILGRTPHKVEAMVAKFGGTGNLLKDAQKEIESSDLIINTTSAGMFPQQNAIPIAPEWLKPHHTVFDLIYKPLKTKLLQEAEKRNSKTINGLPMLVYQGARSFELWTGIDPTKIMQKSIRNILNERMENG